MIKSIGFRILLGMICAGTLRAAPVTQQWTFEGPGQPKGLALPRPYARIVAGAAGGHVLQIATDRPSHTVVRIVGSEAHPNFLLSLKVRVVSWTGAPPVIYLYGRQAKGGFRGLQYDRSGCGILCWRGRGARNTRFGEAGVRLGDVSGWVCLCFACFGNTVAAKSWVAGTPEPGWQVEGMDRGQAEGWAGFGVWRLPAKPTPATVRFDDVRYRTLDPADAAALGLAMGPRQPLDLAAARAAKGVFVSGDCLGLRSGPVAIAFDRRTGDLAHVVDLASGQEFVSAQLCTPLFELLLSRPFKEEKRTVSARDFRKIEVEKAGADSVRLRFSSHIVLPLTVTVTARARGGKIALRQAVTGLGTWSLAASRFPQAPAPAALSGDGSADRMLLPWEAGGLLPAPGMKAIRRQADYPGAVVAQFYTLYNKRAGVYWAAEDPAGHCKRLCLDCVPGCMAEMTFQHLFPEIVGANATLPYDVVVTTFHGDWMDAANIYRAWALKQRWCKRPLTRRPDIPAFLKEGAGILIAGIQNPAGRVRQFGKNFERLPGILDAYRRATGLKHMVFVPYGWENRGCWAGINYFPAQPSDDTWRSVNRILRQDGNRTAFLTSGFWWVVRRQKTGNGPAFDDSEQLKTEGAMCIHRPDGSLWAVDNYRNVKTHGSWRGYSVALCHGSPQADATIKNIFLHVASLGVSLISFDQEIGGRQAAPCYARNHGHPPGYGRWMWTSFRDLCAGILAAGKPVQPDLGLLMENVSELAIPYMATYWSRQFGEVDVACPGDRGVGLFPYLYHDYITEIGAACVQGQGRLGTRPGALLRCRVLANNLTRGLIPGPFMQDVPLSPPRDPWRRTVSQAYRAFCKPYAAFPEYLLLGRTVRPPDIECDRVDTYFYRQNNLHGKPLRKGGVPVVKIDLRLKAVTSGSFRAADGSVATVVVNATPNPRTATLRFRDKALKRAYTALRKPLPAANITGGEGTVKLEPFGIRVLVSGAPAPSAH